MWHADFPIPNSHFPIKYHLSFIKSFYKWPLVNLANGKWKMVFEAAGGGV